MLWGWCLHEHKKHLLAAPQGALHSPQLLARSHPRPARGGTADRGQGQLVSGLLHHSLNLFFTFSFCVQCHEVTKLQQAWARTSSTSCKKDITGSTISVVRTSRKRSDTKQQKEPLVEGKASQCQRSVHPLTLFVSISSPSCKQGHPAPAAKKGFTGGTISIIRTNRRSCTKQQRKLLVKGEASQY